MDVKSRRIVSNIPKYVIVKILSGWYKKCMIELMVINHYSTPQTHVSWDRMGVLLMGRAGCTVLGNILAGLLANCTLFSLLLVQALSHTVVLVSQVSVSLNRVVLFN